MNRHHCTPIQLLQVEELKSEKQKLLEQLEEVKAAAEQAEKRREEMRALEEKKHNEEIQFLKRTSQQLKVR